MNVRIAYLTGRIERLRTLIPQTNGEFRQSLEQDLAVFERELARWLAGAK